MIRCGFVIGVCVIALTATANAQGFTRGGGYKDDGDVFSVPSTIKQSNNQISAQFVATNFDYEESMFRSLLDVEKNWVPGAGGSFSLMRDWYVENLYLSARFFWENGKTDYVGAYWGRPFGSLVTTSGATVYDYDLRLGKGFIVQPSFMATPFVGIGYHEWVRQVNAGENYSNGYAGVGVLAQWSFMSRLVLSIDGLVGRTINPQVEVATIPGAIVGSTLALGSSWAGKVGVSCDYAITRSLHVNAGMEWDSYNYGRSNADPTGTYLEPFSNTSNVTVKLGVGYAFGADFAQLK